MSHDLLLDTTSTIAHQPYHDLQSFFCVLLWLCVTMQGPGMHRLTRFTFVTTKIGAWVGSNDAVTCGDAKQHSFTNGEVFQKLVDEFHPYFDGLKPLVARLLRLLFHYNDAKFAIISRTSVTHDEVIAAFTEERNKLDGKDSARPEGGWVDGLKRKRAGDDMASRMVP